MEGGEVKSTFVAGKRKPTFRNGLVSLAVFVIALGVMEPGSRLTAGVQQAPIDLPDGARPLYRVVPLHGARA